MDATVVRVAAAQASADATTMGKSREFTLSSAEGSSEQSSIATGAGWLRISLPTPRRQKVNRNPSWMNRWKFDCPRVFRLIRPKSALPVSC